MVSLYLCVEGGGSHETECRAAFATLLKKAGLTGQMPRIVACGGRDNAFAAFCNHLALGHPVVLLVDSEDAVTTNGPWEHVTKRDKWTRPENATDADLHFMVRSMEAWLLADGEALAEYYRKDFRPNKLPAEKRVERIDRHDSVKALDAASKLTTKKGYQKGAHSFAILCCVDPAKIRKEPWAERFFAAIALRAAG